MGQTAFAKTPFMSSVTAQPLAGVRVLDLTDASGVFATRLLADLGADVVRIEPPNGGSLRHHGPFVEGAPNLEGGYYHLFHNMNKRSVVADLDDLEDLSRVRSLVATADILIESGRPGWLSPHALNYDVLRETNPGLVYVSISPFGQEGPWAGRCGNDLIGAAAGGILGISGSPSQPPMQGNAEPSYKMAGLAAASGALLALHGVRHGAAGVHIDISVHEATVMMGVQSLNPCIYTIEGRVQRRQGIFGPIHRCADGKYVAARATLQSLPRLKALAETRGILVEEKGIPGAEIMKSLAASMTADEIMALVEQFDLIGLPVGSFDDIYRHPHFKAIAQFGTVRHESLNVELISVLSPVAGMASQVPVRAAPLLGEHTEAVFAEQRDTHGRAVMGGVDVARPLSGLRVLDFSWVLAGPLGTRILANFGADVIRIESEARLDMLRAEGESLNTGAVFNDANLGKRSLTLDMSREEAVALVFKLVEGADILIENFRSGVLERMGLGYDKLSKINPGLIVAHLPGCGTTGPWAHRGTFGGVLMAAAGVNDISGFDGEPPYGIACAYPDFTSPYLLTLQILSALREREQTGKGQEIVLNQLAATVSLMGVEWMRWGVEGVAPRNANRNVNYCPHGVFPTQGEDQWIAIAVQGEKQWKHFCQHLGLYELMDDQAFADHEGRRANENALDQWVSEQTQLRDGWQLANGLQALGIAAAKVEMLDDLIERDPQLRHRRHYFETRQPSHPDTAMTMDGEVIRFVGAEVTPSRAPMLGEHSEEILAELAGISPEEFAALVQSGVVR